MYKLDPMKTARLSYVRGSGKSMDICMCIIEKVHVGFKIAHVCYTQSSERIHWWFSRLYTAFTPKAVSRILEHS